MNKREYTKENYLKNGNKTQNNNPKINMLQQLKNLLLMKVV